MFESNPLVSIGVPIFNGEQFLSKTIDSILQQSYFNFELILCNNASTDLTEEICLEYKRKDSRVRYYSQKKNIGAAANYNYTFTLGNGKYFKWAAADDLLHEDYLLKCVDILENNPDVVLAFSKTIFIDENGESIDSLNDTFPSLMDDLSYRRVKYIINYGGWCNVVFGVIRRELLKNTKLIGSYSGQDYRLLGELSLMGKFYKIQKPLFYRRIHPNASSQNTILKWQKEFYNASTNVNFDIPFLVLMYEYFLLICTSNLKLEFKIEAISLILKRIIWRRRRLSKHLYIYFKSLFTNSKYLLNKNLKN